MELKNNIVEQAKDITDVNLVDPRDIPKIDLYMEQVTSFLEQEMGESFRFHDECVFTGTMINNYTKAGVLPRPSNKRYSRRHVLTLISICSSRTSPFRRSSVLPDLLKIRTSSSICTTCSGNCWGTVQKNMSAILVKSSI